MNFFIFEDLTLKNGVLLANGAIKKINLEKLTKPENTLFVLPNELIQYKEFKHNLKNTKNIHASILNNSSSLNINEEDQLVLNTSNNYDFFLTTNKYQEDIKKVFSIFNTSISITSDLLFFKEAFERNTIYQNNVFLIDGEEAVKLSMKSFNLLEDDIKVKNISDSELKKLKNINVLMMDINEKMLKQATKRKEYREHKKSIDFIVSDAENIPLASNSIDCIAIAFGIRNVASIENALLEINRVLKCGGKFLCLEFSNVEVPLLKKFYSFYSKNIIPEIGSYVVKDRRSYQYLVESIERFPKQDELTGLFTKSGFINSKYTNLSGGIACIHSGWKM